jgi:hypothetical protein
MTELGATENNNKTRFSIGQKEHAVAPQTDQ